MISLNSNTRKRVGNNLVNLFVLLRQVSGNFMRHYRAQIPDWLQNKVPKFGFTRMLILVHNKYNVASLSLLRAATLGISQIKETEACQKWFKWFLRAWPAHWSGFDNYVQWRNRSKISCKKSYFNEIRMSNGNTNIEWWTLCTFRIGHSDSI